MPDLFLSSPSAWSYMSSPSQEHLSPLTPDPYFTPIVTPDSSLSADDASKVRVFLRNKGHWENMYDHFESSPPRVLSQDNATDRFSWDPALLDANQLADPSRCSLLIQEVSLLVGLTPDHDHLPPVDVYPSVLDGSKQLPDILPLTLTPTKSLAPRKHRNASLSRPRSMTNPIRPSNNHILSARPDNTSSSIRNEKPPIPRCKRADADHSSLSSRRRQGRIFHFESPAGIVPRPDALELDKTFLDPREPPPKPISNLPANRCSSLDRLECSLMKLEAYAPYHHRKSQSDGRAPIRVTQKSDKRPSLPPPRRLKKLQSSHDVLHRNAPRFAHPSPSSCQPLPKQVPIHPHDALQLPPAVSLDNEKHEQNLIPGSFMDMDITCAEEASWKQQESSPQMKSKEKMKNLVSVAKRLSRGVIAWGKNLTGSMKQPDKAQEPAAPHSSRF